ncbi:hypothetical protein Afil01_53180 [Actinorhabdospora filicis]|uniref:PH domain-containing protein n=1 Tax=Actinorhabdospora filicis TaxID=1785913 RepID=A0A9W6WCE4_9ACTN|nr:hypothetical protein [Actinorhabdospora filicis]GLZ80511.1 hypothetical protein Afil01_53180 [Actinorhabdospora filicis]
MDVPPYTGERIAPRPIDCFRARMPLVAPVVISAVAVGVWFSWPMSALMCLAIPGLVLLAVADTLVSVRVDAAGILAENRWTRARVPWLVAGSVDLALPEPGSRSFARAYLTTRAGERVPLDVVVTGATRASAAALAAWLAAEVEARRPEGPAAGDFVVERPAGRIALRVAGIVLVAVSLGALVMLFGAWLVTTLFELLPSL